MVYFLFRMTTHNGDVSYNSAGLGTSALIDISLGVIVSCSLSLPRFFEVKGQGILRTFSRPFTTFTGSSSSRTRTSQSKTELSLAALSDSHPQRINKMKKGQTLSETNLTFDLDDFGQQQNDKDGIAGSTVNDQEHSTLHDRHSHDKHAVLNHVV
jgi:hypothetical protein